MPLCDSGSTLLVNVREGDRIDPARKPPNVTLGRGGRDLPALIDWLVETR